MTCVKSPAAGTGDFGRIVRAACRTRLIRINARFRARAPHGRRRIPGVEGAMDNTFEWVDFALQPPGVVVECLDAAGVDGSVPGHGGDGEE